MLEIKGLSVSYNGQPVLNGVNLSLERGESLSVIGESGAGKTTLGMSIMGLVVGWCTGEIAINRRNVLAMEEEDRRRMRGRDMVMVFQNVEEALHPLYTVLDQVAEAILVHNGADSASAVKKSLDLLRCTGLDEPAAKSYPHQLSGARSSGR